MATVNFSVPDEFKEAFNNAHHGQNKSAIIADLMREAVESFEREQKHRYACKSILALRQQMPPVSTDEAQAARDELRGS